MLWQPSLPDEPSWSRCGPGRPGWHIECLLRRCASSVR
ncbi:MAG: hypothetical protein R2716_11405 [Microthrixaceae bacterium]